MLLLEKMRKAGFHQYDQVIQYCNEHDIRPSFQARDATILFVDEAMKSDRPDYLIYMVDAAAEPAPICLLGNDAQAAKIIIAVNKM